MDAQRYRSYESSTTITTTDVNTVGRLEEQKRVDSLCGVAGVKLVPDEAELTQLFEHVDRKGLEASLIVRALLDKVALAYDSELMDAQSGWKCAKKRWVASLKPYLGETHLF